MGGQRAGRSDDADGPRPARQPGPARGLRRGRPRASRRAPRRIAAAIADKLRTDRALAEIEALAAGGARLTGNEHARTGRLAETSQTQPNGH
jgi:hypothetical protein